MKHVIQVIGLVALVGGLSISYNAWQCQSVADAQARREAEAIAQARMRAGNTGSYWSTPAPQIPVLDRELGMAFGLGLSFLGAFGLYAPLRVPDRQPN